MAAHRFFTERRSPELEGGSFLSRRYVYINFNAVKAPSVPIANYILAISTDTPDWVFIRSGESLILKLDDSEMLTISGAGSFATRRTLSASSLQETAAYTISIATFERISKAKKVGFRVLGDRQNITGTWLAEHIADASQLLQQTAGLTNLAPANEQGIKPPRLGV